MGQFLGTLEHLILLAVLRLGDDAYGNAILDELETSTGRAPSSGSLSTTLDRLEHKGLLTSRYAEATPGRGGRPKRVVRITAQGRRELRATQQAVLRLSEDLPETLT